MTEDEMVGWHHRLNGYEFEQALGVDDRQGSLMCCSPWGQRELDMTYGLIDNNSMKNFNTKSGGGVTQSRNLGTNAELRHVKM